MIQFGNSYDGDYVRIFDVNDDGNSTVIASLYGPDFGPESHFLYSHWQKKIISSTSKAMLVEFRSDDVREEIGFSASIHYSPMPFKQCENALDMAKKTIQSPNYPDFYENNLSCKWLISVPDNFHITLKFLQFDVRFLVNNYLIYIIGTKIHCSYCSWKIMVFVPLLVQAPVRT